MKRAEVETISEYFDRYINLVEDCALFQLFGKEDFQKSGIKWKHRITVEAMGFNILGHQIHHFQFIENNYYSLARR